MRNTVDHAYARYVADRTEANYEALYRAVLRYARRVALKLGGVHGYEAGSDAASDVMLNISHCGPGEKFSRWVYITVRDDVRNLHERECRFASFDFSRTQSFTAHEDTFSSYRLLLERVKPLLSPGELSLLDALQNGKSQSEWSKCNRVSQPLATRTRNRIVQKVADMLMHKSQG